MATLKEIEEAIKNMETMPPYERLVWALKSIEFTLEAMSKWMDEAEIRIKKIEDK